MANFTSEIKRDILKTCPEERSCRLALLAGVVDTSGFSAFEFSDGGNTGEFSFTHENEDTAEYLLALVDKLFGVSMTVTNAERDPKNGRDKLTFSYFGKDAGLYADEISDFSAGNLFTYDLPEIEECRRAYLKGAFLGGGSCTLPHGGAKTGYHLEFVFRSELDGENFCELLESLDLIGKMIRRGDKAVVYLKSREAISDALYSLDAVNALKRLEDLTAVREESNRQNRLENCFAGNADKSAIACARQKIAFEKLKAKGVLDTLSRELQETAKARLENPSFSLVELAGELGVSKSCLNHRMRKLMEIYGKEKL